MAGERRQLAVDGEVFSIPAVHSRYLKYCVPSAGIESQFNPPVLRWPLTEGKSVTYDVRLSRDSSFTKDVIAQSGTQLAMFNPHTKLPSGDWYWQYRHTGGEWSPVNHFVIDDTAIDLVSPAADRFLEAIPETHPRVLAGADQLPLLRQLKGEADGAAIVAEADVTLARSIPRETDGQPSRMEKDEDRAKKLSQDASNVLGKTVYTAVSNLCQAWLLSGDARYQERATAIAMEVASWNPRGITGSKVSDFSDARCMLAMALVFDTFHDDLPAGQREALEKAIGARAEGFYNSWVNNMEARVLSGHVWQHILHYFFQTALAMHGHDQRAAGWLAYAYELFLARAPILGGTDGGWAEGVSYFRMNMETLIDIPLFIKKFTGFDFINAHPWYTRNVNWLVYHIPPGSSSDGFGDNAEEVFTPGAEYIAYANELAKLTGSPLAAWYATACERYETPQLWSEPTLRWVRLTKTREIPLEELSADPDFPIANLCNDIGMVAMHSDPTDATGNLAVTLRSSPLGCYGHFLADQNAFNILYGGKRTFFHTGFKVTMADPHRVGWYQHTKSSNSVLVNGEGQPCSTESFGWIRKLLQGKEMAYALADASNAYSSDEMKEDRGVSKFFRHVMLLKPDIIVIYDELEAREPVEWTWLIHAMAEIQTDSTANSFQSSFGHANGAGRLWSSDPVRWVLRDTFDVPAINWRGSKDDQGNTKSYEENQWHLQARTRSSVPRARFLAVLQVSPRANPGNITVDEEGSNLTVAVDGWTISANINADNPPSLEITNEQGTTVFLLSDEGQPALTEQGASQTKTTTGEDILPWYLKQSVMVHRRIEVQR